MNRNSNNARSFQKLSLVAGLFAIALAGCTTLTPEQQRAEDEKNCLSYGFKPKSEAMANCLLQIHLDRRADIRAWQNERPQFSTPMVIYQPVVVPR
ncbi:hypothetical protein KHQ08_17560 [Pseudochrobactrum algeriensis]|uniref:hypothetical protein n=1 Tax=Pseudochrobactrum algeriensis TaxID=2834768 RepID=UPI001BD0C8D0|nr:hypothetical protein [Pseudochrobactrum algeriensis]MBX8813881.1 hypothetical protein [Ochrobactrum sp. MR34]QVQ36848.1 hypothetical protein KHQ08_17560 [Pseudochrobactrum algeriensis]QVQ40064.1 hypothetical protein KHQ07_15825 [Pseudochrobactrum algeriensis]QVQ43987.1 hypothetical protein KHQ09_17785 [Pseudochrobactrum algeriensis]